MILQKIKPSSQNKSKKKDFLKKKEMEKQIRIKFIENKPPKFLNPLKLVKIFKDFYLSFAENNINYNLENFPIFMNNALTVSGIENHLNLGNNGKRYPCIIFHVNRREISQISINLIYERLISMSDSLAKEVAEKIIKINNLMQNYTDKVKPQPLTIEEKKYKLNYQQKLQNLLIDLDKKGNNFCVMKHEQDGNGSNKNILFILGDLTMTKIILNKNLVNILTDEPEKYMMDSLSTGIPSFFGIKNIYQMYLNIFKNLIEVPQKKYGIVFNEEQINDEIILQNCYHTILHAKCLVQNSFIYTKNYHERNLIRCFSPLNENIVFQNPKLTSRTCSYKIIKNQ